MFSFHASICQKKGLAISTVVLPIVFPQEAATVQYIVADMDIKRKYKV